MDWERPVLEVRPYQRGITSVSWHPSKPICISGCLDGTIGLSSLKISWCIGVCVVRQVTINYAYDLPRTWKRRATLICLWCVHCFVKQRTRSHWYVLYSNIIFLYWAMNFYAIARDELAFWCFFKLFIRSEQGKVSLTPSRLPATYRPVLLCCDVGRCCVGRCYGIDCPGHRYPVSCDTINTWHPMILERVNYIEGLNKMSKPPTFWMTADD